MTCWDFENQWQEWLDQRRPEFPAELADHASVCSACREFQQQLQHLEAAVEVWRAVTVSSNLADQVLTRRAAEQGGIQVLRASARSSSASGWSALLVSALALMVAVGVGWRMSGNIQFAQRQAAMQHQIAMTTAQRIEAFNATSSSKERQLDVLLHDARDAYAALASQAWQQASTADLLLPPTDAPLPFLGGEAAEDVSGSLSRPLEPIGKGLREAVDSWLQHVFNSQDSATST